mmetsp:Transcript_19140/g.34908  ORF Transcript_19140/g.34908 Transcript_19140/m.34908 type:complete len:506 (-) Transcript_19140:2424-3941(-)
MSLLSASYLTFLFRPFLKIPMGSLCPSRASIEPPLPTPDIRHDFKHSASSFIVQKRQAIWTRYERLDELGRGTFGIVYRAKSLETQHLRAVKMIFKAKVKAEDMLQFTAEIEVLRTLDHPNILKLYEFYEDSKCFYLVTEYLAGGELFDFIIKQQALSESMAAQVMNQLLSAVNYCHKNNIVHRDLKPENLLLAEAGSLSQIKVIDFGTSTLKLPGQTLQNLKGTAYYIAPEMLGKPYNEKCDLWSCGVILHVMLSGTAPFIGPDSKTILARVKKAKYKLEGQTWDSVSDMGKDLVRKLMEPDPARRLSAEDALNHQWITIHNSANPPKTEYIEAGLQSLKSFRATSKLKQAACVFISSQMIGEKEKQVLTTAFKALDTNNDGKLSASELEIGFRSLYTEEEAQAKVNELLKQIDVDGNGFVEYSEFLSAGMQLDAEENKQRLEDAFNIFDSDKSGGISLEELKEILGSYMDADTDWDQLFRDVDSDHSGEISFEEFKALLYKVA